MNKGTKKSSSSTCSSGSFTFVTAHPDSVHREFQLPQPPEKLEQLGL